MAIRGARARVSIGLLAGALLGMAAPVAGEERWSDFIVADKGFQIQFPGEPERADVTYQAASPDGGRAPVPASRYAVQRGRTHYAIEIAELAGSSADHPKALDHAVAARLKQGEAGLDTWVSIANGTCGRYLGLTLPSGALNYVALFYTPESRRLYDIEAIVPQDDQAEQGADAVHFQQSLSFLADPDAKPPAPPEWPEGWSARTYDDPGFTVRFPAEPAIERFSYVTRDGVVVPATRYSARDDLQLYQVTVVHAWETEADTPDVVDQAAAVWQRQATGLEVEVTGISNGQCGRDLRADFPGEGRARARVFFPSSQHRIYIIETRGLGRADDGGRAGLFQASFSFAKPQED